MNNKMKKHEGSLGYYPSLLSRFFDDDFFNNFAENSLPAVNVKETKKEYKLEISAPGFEKGDIHIEIDRNIMTISGKKNVENEEKDKDEKVLRREFSTSTFSRSFTLPEHVDTGKIEAKEKNGVLKIKLPKNERALEDKVRRIAIK